MIGWTVGNYRIVEKLGEGGMGSVFRGIDQMVERSVAIKVLKPGLTTTSTTHNRFLSEAKALAKLNHPAIAMLYSFFLEGDEYFMVMEYVPGQNLETLIRTHGAIRWPQAVTTLARILDGMGHAHAQGIIHRDLKPANIMLSFNGDVKITDFGIARVFYSPKITRESRVVGTMEYLAPERALGMEADERTDIYSLGVILYEMLTGRLPFEGHSEYELIRAQVEQPPKPLGELGVAVPAAVEQALMTALAKDPASRHSDTQAFAAQLRAALAQDDTPALRPMTSETIETQTSSPARVKDLPPAPSSETLPLPTVKATPAAAPPAEPVIPPVETAAPAPTVTAAPEPPAPKKAAPSPWPAFLAKWPLEVRAAVAGGILVLVIIIAGVSFWQRAGRRKADAERLRAAQIAAATPAPVPETAASAPPTEPAPSEPVPDAVPAAREAAAAPPDASSKPKVAPRPANARPPAAIKVLPAPPTEANAGKPAATVSAQPEPVQPEPVPVSAPAPPKAEEPPPPPSPSVQKLADVKSVYLTPMPEKLDTRLRQEIENEFKGRLRVAADLAAADAVMTVVIEDEHGTRISGAAGKLSEVKGTRHAIAALRDRSGSRQLWTASVDDKHSFVSSLGDDVKRLASRLAKRLHVDLH